MNKLDRLARRFRTKPLRLLLLPWLIWLPGCAVNDYSHYATEHAKVEQARYTADAARYAAMAAIAADGGEAAKVAAVMAMQQHSQDAQSTKLQAPQPNQALQWASILVPGLTQMVGMRYQYASTVAQSNNSRAIAESNNATYLGIAGKIQAPAANYTLSGTGAIGGTYSTDRHDSTLSGTGAIGGSYSDSNNRPVTTTETSTDSHQTSTATDDHSTVTPTPVVVTPIVTSTPVTSTLTTTTGSTGFTPWVTP